MKTLVAGASGATGRLLVEQLLNRGFEVKAFLREGSKLPDHLNNHENLTIIRGTVLDMSDTELADTVQDCGAVASCLGHNISFKGLFLPPRRLVRDSIQKLYQAVRKLDHDSMIKFVLMNTVAVQNIDLKEPMPVKNQIVLGILHLLLPPHNDNEAAANFLRTQLGQLDPRVEWVSVRPSGLIDETEVSEYDAHPSPQSDPIFNDGQISRINVAHFMADLIHDDDLWAKWKGQMPVIYNRDHEG